MSSNTGVLFRVTTWGESHGGALGAVIDGCPPGITLDIPAIQADLDRRRPGQSDITTPRNEADKVEILSGLFEGKTLGSCLSLVIYNKDANPESYRNFKDLYRPSHADFTTEAKYGIRNWQGGGRASARETAARVAAGAVAKQVLRELAGITIVGWVDQVGQIKASVNPESVTLSDVESNIVRCPDINASESMLTLIRDVQKDGDTIGGVIRCVARGVPAGLGEPVFDKLEADLAKSMLSLPASKGFESGLGYASLGLKGSEHNDSFIQNIDGRVETNTNNSGGIQGGISNGMPITISVAFKPVATIFHAQETINNRGEKAEIKARGRHDPCVLPRAVPMVEAGVALVLADHLLRQRGIVGRL